MVKSYSLVFLHAIYAALFFFININSMLIGDSAGRGVSLLKAKIKMSLGESVAVFGLYQNLYSNKHIRNKVDKTYGLVYLFYCPV